MVVKCCKYPLSLSYNYVYKTSIHQNIKKENNYDNNNNFNTNIITTNDNN